MLFFAPAGAGPGRAAAGGPRPGPGQGGAPASTLPAQQPAAASAQQPIHYNPDN
ncbi:MAG: hypothetical protein WKG07_14245 [Hymenobacter sp.]